MKKHNNENHENEAIIWKCVYEKLVSICENENEKWKWKKEKEKNIVWKVSINRNDNENNSNANNESWNMKEINAKWEIMKMKKES